MSPRALEGVLLLLATLAFVASAAAIGWLVVRLQIAPARRLALALAATAPLWLLSGSPAGFTVALGVSAAIATAVLVDFLVFVIAWRRPATTRFSVSRTLPSTVGIGEPAEGGYTVHAHRGGATTVALFDSLPNAIEKLDGPPAWLRIAPGTPATIRLTVRGLARGLHGLGPIALRVPGFIGLLQQTLLFHPHDTITVAPSLSGVRRFRLMSLQHRLRDFGVRAIRRRGEGTTFANLREYAVGDDPRHIDWKATARRGKVIAREFTVEQGQTVVIAIDAGRMMTQLAGRLARFEHALSSALVLADVAAHSGDQVGLLLFDDEVRTWIPPQRGTHALQRVRDALIEARASMVEPDYAAAFRTLAARHRRRSLIVLFTDVIDPRSSQAVIAHSSRSAARHLPLVVALRNEALVSAALPAGRDTPAGLFEAAAAEELVSAREAALQRMRRAGVAVVDVAPQAMTAAVVNRYLEIKARSSL